jgi:hypothetical protein
MIRRMKALDAPGRLVLFRVPSVGFLHVLCSWPVASLLRRADLETMTPCGDGGSVAKALRLTGRTRCKHRSRQRLLWRGSERVQRATDGRQRGEGQQGRRSSSWPGEETARPRGRRGRGSSWQLDAVDQT